MTLSPEPRPVRAGLVRGQHLIRLSCRDPTVLCPAQGAGQSTAAGMMSGAATITAHVLRVLDTALLTPYISTLALQHGSSSG